MAKLRVSEVYLSIQGEGPRVGHPTVFIRFAGCNLRCPGWPCDTPFAIDPTIFRSDAKLLATDEIVAQVKAAAPHGANICFTGGEPFLQNSDSLRDLSDALAVESFLIQEVFTNGTLRFPEWALDSFYFIMDFKLPGSGEEASIEGTEGVGYTRRQNLMALGDGDALKFTIADRADYEYAKEVYAAARYYPFDFYYGVVWGKLEASELISWVLTDGLVEWIYTHQLHNVIWDRTKRGI